MNLTARVVMSEPVLALRSGKKVRQLWTDAAVKENACYIERTDPYPVAGDEVEIGPNHVMWKGQRLKKHDWLFDPDAPR